MVDARFSALAGLACTLVTLLSAAQGAWAVAVVFGLISAGFLARAIQDYRRL